MNSTIQPSIKDRIQTDQNEASEVVNTPAEMLQRLNKQMKHKSDGSWYYLDRIWVLLTGDARTLIMDEAHKSKYSVHPRADKMYHDLRDMYWWLGMKKDIALYGLEYGRYGVSGFLRVGTTFDIFQNILFLYSLNMAYYLLLDTAYWILFPLWSLIVDSPPTSLISFLSARSCANYRKNNAFLSKLDTHRDGEKTRTQWGNPKPEVFGAGWGMLIELRGGFRGVNEEFYWVRGEDGAQDPQPTPPFARFIVVIRKNFLFVYLVEHCARKYASIRSPIGIREGLGEHLTPMERHNKIPIGDQGGVLPSSGYGVLDLVSFVVFGECSYRYVVSSLMDTTYWLSEQGNPVDAKLNFVEEPIEIIEHEFKKLKWSRIPIVKLQLVGDRFGNVIAWTTIAMLIGFGLLWTSKKKFNEAKFIPYGLELITGIHATVAKPRVKVDLVKSSEVNDSRFAIYSLLRKDDGEGGGLFPGGDGGEGF
uniref:Putative reverse transcriptase domain-containing protein n=1 Tax=Tanacetum cinerariifolium TaxID=118510 RepID=A0A6L2KXP4_TANCI|nr:putative reverse transcriptase domain-containing protein [Tanacetum cinerariifolium]